MDQTFQGLISTFQSTISDWGFYCDFDKIEKNTFAIKQQLSLLNSLLGENLVARYGKECYFEIF